MNTSQQILVQAVEKLSTAVQEVGTAPNCFATKLLELLEVSTKISQFDELADAANAETTSAEAKQWRDISLMTMQHARTHLVEQQQRLVEELRALSDSGASLYQAPDTLAVPMAVKPPPELAPEVKSDQMAVKPPPGLAPPPGLSMPVEVTNRKPSSPPGLKPPPGLASAGTAPAATPPGFNTPANHKLATQMPKKEASVHPWRIGKKVDNTKISSSPEAQINKENMQSASLGMNRMINLDAYDSD